MVIGNHAHWAGAMEVYEGKPIWYALGNFVFDQTWSEPTMEGITLELTFRGPTLVQARMRPHIILDKAQPNFLDPAGDGRVVMGQVFDASKGPAALVGPVAEHDRASGSLVRSSPRPDGGLAAIVTMDGIRDLRSASPVRAAARPGANPPRVRSAPAKRSSSGARLRRSATRRQSSGGCRPPLAQCSFAALLAEDHEAAVHRDLGHVALDRPPLAVDRSPRCRPRS